ncbi:DNA cytosine methyltransferase [Streptosporangium sp. NPDC001681]|uniref:DNA cytosine methyltransferase n=1 Tax=Streptosporangium sp. NPDC001681 TaxID=3154395 RepID=UPI0033170F4B
MAYRHDSDVVSLTDWFCGAGGSSQGAHAVPNVDVTLAANHWDLALKTHRSNFPNTRHEEGDIREAPVYDWPKTLIHWASTECTKWSIARGKKQDFRNSRQGKLFDFDKTEEEREQEDLDEESRALTSQVADYIEGVYSRRRSQYDIVLCGVMENVLDEYDWDGFPDFRRRFHRMGYKTRAFGINSMHAQPVRTLAAPQSRDRLYLAYWHECLGRDPDFDKWLRPQAYCQNCDQMVPAISSYKRPGVEAGKYRVQYVWRCPNSSCRRAVDPPALPAWEAIDFTLPTREIGDGKPGKNFRPYAPSTVGRIQAGIDKYWVPLLVPTGGTWRTDATPLTAPMPTRTTRENDGLAVPPLLVPTEGREGKVASPSTAPGRTQTTRRETGVAFPPEPFLTLLRSGQPSKTDPLATDVANGSNHGLAVPPSFIVPMRGGGDKERARSIDGPLHTVTAGGNHHYLATAPQPLMVPYYTNGTAKPVSQPVGTLTTLDRYGVATPPPAPIDINKVGFRMLEPFEIGRGMAFQTGYVVHGDKRAQVKQYGNAVTPPVAEVLVSALVECITGEALERHLVVG